MAALPADLNRDVYGMFKLEHIPRDLLGLLHGLHQQHNLQWDKAMAECPGVFRDFTQLHKVRIVLLQTFAHGLESPRLAAGPFPTPDMERWPEVCWLALQLQRV